MQKCRTNKTNFKLMHVSKSHEWRNQGWLVLIPPSHIQKGCNRLNDGMNDNAYYHSGISGTISNAVCITKQDFTHYTEANRCQMHIFMFVLRFSSTLNIFKVIFGCFYRILYHLFFVPACSNDWHETCDN